MIQSQRKPDADARGSADPATVGGGATHGTPDQLAQGECPGYCGAPDTFHVGMPKWLGRLSQQMLVDIYGQVRLATLHACRSPLTAADLLNNRVLSLD